MGELFFLGGTQSSRREEEIGEKSFDEKEGVRVIRGVGGRHLSSTSTTFANTGGLGREDKKKIYAGGL